MHDTASWIARRIREAREQAGLSQAELADRLGRTQTAISYWESAKRSPGVDDLIEIAAVVDRSLADLLPPAVSRRPARALLRATTEQLQAHDALAAMDDVISRAEAEMPPTGEFVVSQTRPELAARELLTAAGVLRPPIDVEALARRCGAQVVHGRFPDSLSGFVAELDDRVVIGVNAGHAPVRRRFTIAHELGHHLLRHYDRFHVDFGPNDEHGNPPGYDWRSERDANDFAAELLMPAALIAERWPLTRSVEALAAIFKVSTLAMGYRLTNLGLN